MKIGRDRAAHHKNGDMTAKCCCCGKSQRHKEWHWSESMIGLDFVAYKCPDCVVKVLERQVRQYEEAGRS